MPTFLVYTRQRTGILSIWTDSATGEVSGARSGLRSDSRWHTGSCSRGFLPHPLLAGWVPGIRSVHRCVADAVFPISSASAVIAAHAIPKIENVRAGPSRVPAQPAAGYVINQHACVSAK